jgi:hypothetical protein
MCMYFCYCMHCLCACIIASTYTVVAHILFLLHIHLSIHAFFPSCIELFVRMILSKSARTWLGELAHRSEVKQNQLCQRGAPTQGHSCNPQCAQAQYSLVTWSLCRMLCAERACTLHRSTEGVRPATRQACAQEGPQETGLAIC